MSNEVINPFQLIRDKRGVPLAAGKLRIYENRTTTIGTAFVDSELTIPQSVDPYILDNYGRVQGDLRWSGERTVEVYDADNGLVRTLHDVVTLVDTSGFAINFASVADMAADTSLEAGDICETQSYNVDQRQGGARYIVTNSVLTVDDYLVIDLAPAGLQARLLDEEQNKNFYVAGAVGDGVADDSIPIQRLLNIGGNIECANGIFRAENLTLSLGARIHGNGTLQLNQFATNDLLTLSGEDLIIWLDGITLDGDASNQISEATLSLVSSSITASETSIISFTNVTFNAPALYAVEGVGDNTGDSVVYSFGTCRFLAGLEASSTYVPAYVSLTDGVNGTFDDCYFDLEATPEGGRAGIVTANAVFLNPGYLSVSDCTFNRIGADPDSSNNTAVINAREIRDLMISDCRFISPQVAAVLWGAEVDGVQVSGNLVDSLSSTNMKGAIVAEVTTAADPGNSWQIQDNQILGSDLYGIRLDGASAGIDAGEISILGNLIDSPTLQAISLENIAGLDVRGNYINMESIAGVNAIEVDADGVIGTCTIEGNTVVNVDGNPIDLIFGSTAIYVIDSNTIEGVTSGVGINVDNCNSVFIRNNALDEVATTLIAIGATVTTAMIEGNGYTGTTPTNWVTDAGANTFWLGENFFTDFDDAIKDIVAAATISVRARYHELTGTTAVTTINFAADILGQTVVLAGGDANTRTITDGGNLNLAGNFSQGQNDTLTLAWGGSVWNEVSRSNN